MRRPRSSLTRSFADDEAPVLAAEEEERAGVVGRAEVEHAADDDDVVAAAVPGPELAVGVGDRVVEHRRPAHAEVPVGLPEPVGALRREEPGQLLLVLAQDVHRERPPLLATRPPGGPPGPPAQAPRP